MIFRLSEKLNTKIRAKTLATLPQDENPFADWSAHLFVAERTQYILLSNTKSLYSTVLPGKGITDESTFIERAQSSIREIIDTDGQEGVYERLVVPVSGSVRFAKALNRSVTGSMNDMIKHAAYYLATGDVSPVEIGSRLKEIPMSALKHGRSTHGFPRDVFKAMVENCRIVTAGERLMIESLLDACQFVLENLGEPQSSYWLASQVMEMKLWRASEADVRAALQKDIEEHGERSRFVFVGDDEFALRSWKAD